MRQWCRGASTLLPLAAKAVGIKTTILGVEIDTRNHLETDLFTVFRDIEDLSQITGVLATLDTDPATDLDLVLHLLQLEQIGHLGNGNQMERGGLTCVGTCETTAGLDNIICSPCFDIELAWNGVTAESRDDAHGVGGEVLGHGLANECHDNVPLSTRLAWYTPQARILDGRHEQTLRNLGIVGLAA